MCGIYGYVGEKNAHPIIKSGLQKLEYRGYDSCGICIIEDGEKFRLNKAIGGASNLSSTCPSCSCDLRVGIGHNRWATHGKVTIENAHPHVSSCGKVALVHNGVIENSDSIKDFLLKKKFSFSSDTDSEVLCNLISYYLNSSKYREVERKNMSLIRAVKMALRNVEGTYGIVVASTNEPRSLVCARRSSPLAIGSVDDEHYISSDPNAFPHNVNKVVFLEDGQVALLSKGDFDIFDLSRDRLVKGSSVSREIVIKPSHMGHGSYNSFLEKEIFEQPEAIENTINGRLRDSDIKFGGIEIEDKVKRILFIGCGTAYYAGLLGKYYMENIAGVPASVEFASEYKYKNNPTEDGTLVVALSQSGETIDTLQAIQESQKKSLKTIAITNGVSSTIARQVDEGIYQRIGPEISVASTKAFTSQATIVLMLSILIGRQKNISRTEAKVYIDNIRKLPDLIREALSLSKKISGLSKKYGLKDAIDFLGRQYMYPIALESSLKLKELAYLNSNAYPSGEIKHGPLAVIGKGRACLYFATQSSLVEKDISTMREIKSREGELILIKTKSQKIPKDCYDDVLSIPDLEEYLAPIVSVVVSQIFCMDFARKRNKDIDKPRHLAKSVTVE